MTTPAAVRGPAASGGWAAGSMATAPRGEMATGPASKNASVSRDHCTAPVARSTATMRPRALAHTTRPAAGSGRGDHPGPGVDAPPLRARGPFEPDARRAGIGRDRNDDQIAVDHRPVEAGPGHRGAPHLPAGAIERPDGAARRRHDDTCGVGRGGRGRVVELDRPLRVARARGRRARGRGRRRL